MRELIVELIDGSGEFRVVATAGTGYEAIRLVHDLDPDIVTLDLEMPELGGLDTLSYIINETPRPVIILSSHGPAGAEPTFRALDYGAVDFVLKPAGDERREIESLQSRLLSALRAAAVAQLGNLGARAPASLERKARRIRSLTRPQASPASATCAVAIGASTGGPRALLDLIPQLPAGLPAAVLVVQHMPPRFTRSLADRLALSCPLPVQEVEGGEPVQPGRVYIARAGFHLGMRRTRNTLELTLDDGTEPLWGVRPAVDMLFTAVARHFGPRSIGVVLTGMGRDGAQGLRAIREVGGWTMTQDQGTSVVFGMPRAAAPYAREVLPLQEIGTALVQRVEAIAQARP